MASGEPMTRALEELLTRLATLQLYQRDGRRSPHKSLLVLLALGRLATNRSSELAWSEAQVHLGSLITEFGPASKTSRPQNAAYPFTRPRSGRRYGRVGQRAPGRVCLHRDKSSAGLRDTSHVAAAVHGVRGNVFDLGLPVSE
jgi:hypothetical protein